MVKLYFFLNRGTKIYINKKIKKGLDYGLNRVQ
jgi:hypothetical protein